MPNIPGTQTGNTLNGSTTADSIVGFEGNDSILANGGNDTIWAGAGNDTVFGGDGADVLYGDQDRVATWGYRVYDRNFSSANGQAFTIESGTLRGSGLSTGFDVAGHALAARGTTGDPNDFGVIYTSTFTATTAGTYTFRTSSDDGSTIRLLDGSGNPLVWSGQSTGQTGLTYLNNDFHQGVTTRQASVTLAAGQTYTIELRFWENAGGNSLTADVAPPGGGFQSLTNNTTFIGTGVYAGNDSLDGGTGNDLIYGEAGNDSISGSTGLDTLYGGTGNDTIRLGVDADADVAYGDDGADVIYTEHTSTTVADTVYGGAGNDIVYGGAGIDLLFGGADDDLILGGAGNDTVHGDAGNDTLIGGDGVDIAYGGTGDDRLIGNGGDDSLYGGDGADLIVTGNNNGAFAGTDDTAANVNYVEAGDGDDTILGSIARDQVFGDAGNDLIDASGGNDEVYGGTGNETITGGVGDDRMFGGDGSDRFILDDNHDNDTIVGNEDTGDIDVVDANAVNGNLTVNVSSFEAGTITGAGLSTIFSEIERLELGSGNDTVTVASAGDTIQLDGNGGIDRLLVNGTPILRGDVALDNTATGTFTPGNGAPAIPFGPAEALQLSDILATYYDGTISISGSTSLDGTIGSVAFEDFEELTFDIICFARGTRLRTDRGQRAIEKLRAGDLVATLDHGLQPIRWIGSTTVPALGDLAPIVIRKGALGNRRDLRVSPQHRMLLRGWQAELMFGEDEVLVPAKSLLNDQSILRAQGGTVEYFHILFDSHEIVWAEGALSESFHPGQQGWKALDTATRSEILGLFPQLASSGLPAYGPAARPSLRDFEGRALQAAMGLS